MTESPPTVVTAAREIAAPPDRVFELVADPVRQPEWDGNDNLAEAVPGRVRAVGDVFTTTLTHGGVRENRIVEFQEGRRIAWLPSEPGGTPPGHLWRWELEPVDGGRTRVTGTYDWTGLDPDDAFRQKRARATTSGSLRASLDRLAEVAESE
ncbi:SRPBCC family protein [Pseudonocardia spirodelae]|uniref:SRPBCC family protein n=1 Tax=Pseudonocardia spirodelae TaxID=3133431 RepID=A0ABU8T4D3_9PSEU